MDASWRIRLEDWTVGVVNLYRSARARTVHTRVKEYYLSSKL
jgi:hypothetical protein